MILKSAICSSSIPFLKDFLRKEAMERSPNKPRVSNKRVGFCVFRTYLK